MGSGRGFCELNTDVAVAKKKRRFCFLFFYKNKLQKLEDALVDKMLTAADLGTGVTGVTWLTGQHE